MFMLGKNFEAKKDEGVLTASVDGSRLEIEGDELRATHDALASSLAATTSEDGVDVQIASQAFTKDAHLQFSQGGGEQKLAAGFEHESENGALEVNAEQSKSGDSATRKASFVGTKKTGERETKNEGSLEVDSSLLGNISAAHSSKDSTGSLDVEAKASKEDWDGQGIGVSGSVHSRHEQDGKTRSSKTSGNIRASQNQKSVQAQRESEKSDDKGTQKQSQNINLSRGDDGTGVSAGFTNESELVDGASASLEADAAINVHEGRKEASANFSQTHEEGDQSATHNAKVKMGVGGERAFEGEVELDRIRRSTREGRESSVAEALHLSRKDGEMSVDASRTQETSSDEGSQKRAFEFAGKRGSAGLTGNASYTSDETTKGDVPGATKHEVHLSRQAAGEASISAKREHKEGSEQLDLEGSYEKKDGHHTVNASVRKKTEDAEHSLSGKYEKKDGQHTVDASFGKETEDSELNASGRYEKKDGHHAVNASVDQKTMTAEGEKSLNAKGNASLESGTFSAAGEVSKAFEGGGEKSVLSGKAAFTKSADETRGSLGATQHSDKAGSKRDRTLEVDGGLKDGKIDAKFRGNSRHERENETSEVSIDAAYDGGFAGGLGHKSSRTESDSSVEQEVKGTLKKEGARTTLNVDGSRKTTKGDNTDSLSGRGELGWGEGVRAKVGAGIERESGDVTTSAEGSLGYADKRVEADGSFSSTDEKRTLSGNAQVGIGKGGFKADAAGAYANDDFEATGKAGIGQGRGYVEATYKSEDAEGVMPDEASLSFTGEKGSLGAKVDVAAVSVGVKKGPEGPSGSARFEGEDFGG